MIVPVKVISANNLGLLSSRFVRSRSGMCSNAPAVWRVRDGGTHSSHPVGGIRYTAMLAVCSASTCKQYAMENTLRQELIKFANWLSDSPDKELSVWAVDRYLREINSDAPTGSRSVGGNKGKQEFCNCESPYFPTGNIKHCSKCNLPTAY